MPAEGVATRRAVTVVDDARERTITTFGERLDPAGDSGSAHWDELRELDAVYFTAGDVPALSAARAARVLVASPRARHALGHGVPIDALVLSADDEIERAAAAARRTRSRAGRAHRRVPTAAAAARRSGEEGRWAAVAAAGPAGRLLRLRRLVRRPG